MKELAQIINDFISGAPNMGGEQDSRGSRTLYFEDKGTRPQIGSASAKENPISKVGEPHIFKAQKCSEVMQPKTPRNHAFFLHVRLSAPSTGFSSSLYIPREQRQFGTFLECTRCLPLNQMPPEYRLFFPSFMTEASENDNHNPTTI